MFRRAEVAPRAVRELESPTAFRGFFFFPRVILKLCPEGHKKSGEGCAKGFCRGARAVPGRGPEKIPTFSRGFIFASRSASAGSAHVASRRLFLPAAEEVTEFQGSGKSKIFLWGNSGGGGRAAFRPHASFGGLGLRLLPGTGQVMPVKAGIFIYIWSFPRPAAAARHGRRVACPAWGMG